MAYWHRLERHEKFLFVALGLGTLHLIDHILRHDHAGWPFREDVTPFTFTFLVYPAFAVVLLVRSTVVRAVITMIVAVAVVIGHITETPSHQYTIWATNSSNFWRTVGEQNLLDVESPAVGVASVVISLIATAAFVVNGLWYTRVAWRTRAGATVAGRSVSEPR